MCKTQPIGQLVNDKSHLILGEAARHRISFLQTSNVVAASSNSARRAAAATAISATTTHLDQGANHASAPLLGGIWADVDGTILVFVLNFEG
jgi:hypothetical protein